MNSTLLDAAGHQRQPVTLPGYHAGRPLRNKGQRYPADPPSVEEIIAVMRAGGAGPDDARLRALIVVLWRAGLRISEALALAESDMDPRRGAVLVRRGKGNKRREVGMDTWAWEQLEPWQQLRTQLPVGACLCVIHGPTAGRNWEPSSARRQLRRTAATAGVRRRFAPHQLRHAHAVEMAHEGVPLVVIQRQLGHYAGDPVKRPVHRPGNAGCWVERALGRGGGLVRYGPRHARGGLVQQGWRDTTDPRAAYGGGILDPGACAPEAPLADADTQAVTVAALRAAARLSGDLRWESLAARTVDLIAGAFTPDTMAVTGSDDRVAGAGSQLGWLLWADALPPSARPAYAERLCRPDVLTDFGLRTLSSEHPQFAAEAYHRGPVWPFDSWLGGGGLRAAGRAAEAESVRLGVLAAVDRLGDAPELYAVTPRGPERIAIANRVQAWTIGARFALERSWDGRPPS